ncbi:MAG: hypothetical protein JWM99_1687 [Verrucomicrobiales bacterium]|nr:hypothetical protein [Verrucomicrobiales bacterium]
MSASNSASIPIDSNPLLEKLVNRAPEWKNMLMRIAAEPSAE